MQSVGSELSEEPDPYRDGSRVHPGRFVPKTGESAAEPEAKVEEGSAALSPKCVEEAFSEV